MYGMDKNYTNLQTNPEISFYISLLQVILKPCRKKILTMQTVTNYVSNQIKGRGKLIKLIQCVTQVFGIVSQVLTATFLDWRGMYW